jgi:hypothetical protein
MVERETDRAHDDRGEVGGDRRSDHVVQIGADPIAAAAALALEREQPRRGEAGATERLDALQCGGSARLAETGACSYGGRRLAELVDVGGIRLDVRHGKTVRGEHHEALVGQDVGVVQRLVEVIGVQLDVLVGAVVRRRLYHSDAFVRRDRVTDRATVRARGHLGVERRERQVHDLADALLRQPRHRVGDRRSGVKHPDDDRDADVLARAGRGHRPAPQTQPAALRVVELRERDPVQGALELGGDALGHRGKRREAAYREVLAAGLRQGVLGRLHAHDRAHERGHSVETVRASEAREEYTGAHRRRLNFRTGCGGSARERTGASCAPSRGRSSCGYRGRD